MVCLLALNRLIIIKILLGFLCRRLPHGIIRKELMLNVDNGGRIIFFEDATMFTIVRSYL